MTDLLAVPPLPKAILESTDLSRKAYSYRRGETLIEVVQGENKLSLMQGAERVGSLIGIGPSTGWVIKGFSLLGKYERKGDQYCVIPYEQGQPLVGKEEAVHPLDYLLQRL